MASFIIKAAQGARERSFSIEAKDRAAAEAEVRRLGWEPQTAAPPASTATATAPSVPGAAPAEAAGFGIRRSGPEPVAWGQAHLFAGGGALCLLLGPFLPAVSAFGAGISLWRVGEAWAALCLLAGLMAGCCVFMGSFRFLYRVAATIGALLVLRLVMVYSKLDEIDRAIGSLQEGLGAAAPVSMVGLGMGLGWGWVVLFAGVVLLFMGAWKAGQEGLG
jgi:hypothetical protein